jgi:hypothetical protein
MWQQINKIGWTIWSWSNFATTIQSIRKMGATTFQMVIGKSLIVPTTWARQPPNDASEEVLMVTQLDEERRHLWEMAKANFEKAYKRYKDFVDKFRQEVNFEEGDEVWLNIKKI